VDEGDFYRIKKKILGRFVKSFNSVESIAHNFISYYMKDINILDFTSVIDDITPDDVLNRFKTHFNEDNCVLSVVKP